MITTEPDEVVAPVHDRMPVLLADEQLRPYLDAELNEFGPLSRVSLVYAEAANFLTRKPRDEPPPIAEGELF